MAIINTLLTAKDNMGEGLGKAKKSVKDFSKSANDDLKSTSENLENLESNIAVLKNIDYTSFKSIVDGVRTIRTQMDLANASSAAFAARAALTLGIIGGGAAVLIAAVNHSAEYANELNKISSATGLTVEQLQKLQAVFKDTNIEVDKFGDLNKDTLDHLGDAFRDGSGPGADMKAYGLNLKDYNKYLNQADGGIKALIHTFYSMKAAGKSNAEITNMMETLGSDSSHLITTFNKLGSETAALSAIQEAHAGLTNENAKSYQDYSNKVTQLSHSFEQFQANVLAPTVDDLTALLNIFNADWNETKFANMLRNFVYGGDNEISKFMRWMGNVDAKTVQGTVEYKATQTTEAPQPTTPTGGWVDQSKLKAAADAAAKKFAADKKAADDWLTQQDLNNQKGQDKADQDYAIGIKKLNDYNSKKLYSEEQYQRGVEVLNQKLYTSTLENNYNNKLSDLKDYHDQGLNSEAEYQARVLAVQATYSQQMLDAEYQDNLARLNYLNSTHDASIQSEQDYQDKLKALKDKYAFDTQKNTTSFDNKKTLQGLQAQSAEVEKYNTNMNKGIDAANSFANAIASTAESGSAAWYAATILQKGLMVTQAIMAANLAAVQAMATTPGDIGTKIAAGETARAWGLASAAIIGATAVMEIAGAKAKGGGVDGSKTYLVGEKGPELFTAPGTGGQITSNANLQKALGNTDGGAANEIKYEDNSQIILQGSGISAEDARLMNEQSKSNTYAILRHETRKGGLLNK